MIGVRQSSTPMEISSISGDEVDWDQFARGSDKTVVWFIPREHAKTRKPQRIPLSGDALGIVMEMRALHVQTGSEYVFPGHYNPHGPMAEVSLRKLCGRLKLPGKPPRLPFDLQYLVHRCRGPSLCERTRFGSRDRHGDRENLF